MKICMVIHSIVILILSKYKVGIIIISYATKCIGGESTPPASILRIHTAYLAIVHTSQQAGLIVDAKTLRRIEVTGFFLIAYLLNRIPVTDRTKLPLFYNDHP